MEEAQWQGECAKMGADLDTCREIQKEMDERKVSVPREKQEDMGDCFGKIHKRIP